jgi:hypothetical protein
VGLKVFLCRIGSPCSLIDMITGAQIKAARMLLGWSVPDLARRATMNIADTQELEETAKRPRRRLEDLAIIQTILEDVGIEFIDSVGVQLWPREATRSNDA